MDYPAIIDSHGHLGYQLGVLQSLKSLGCNKHSSQTSLPGSWRFQKRTSPFFLLNQATPHASAALSPHALPQSFKGDHSARLHWTASCGLLQYL